MARRTHAEPTHDISFPGLQIACSSIAHSADDGRLFVLGHATCSRSGWHALVSCNLLLSRTLITLTSLLPTSYSHHLPE